ncbi:MAG: hypothetical protein LC749_01645 [Actinobacteria bacterium]|nr:hypothetical protein [Actinomycetota bacterium]
MSREYWEAIGLFTIEAVALAAPPSARDARRVLTPVAQYVAWQWMSGVPLDRQEMFTRPGAKSFIRLQTKQLKFKTRQHYEWILEQVIAAVVGPPEEPPKVVPGRGAPVKPYTLAEEHAYRVMVGNQATPHRRQNGEVLLALGFGAGLVAGDIVTITGDHVVRVPDGVEIHVPGPRARVVPVFAEWEAIVASAATRAGGGRLFLPSRPELDPGDVSGFTACLQGRESRLSAQRMRSTWILRLLDAGINVNVVLATSGMSGPESLVPYVQFMSPVPDAEARSAIRALSRPGPESVAA